MKNLTQPADRINKINLTFNFHLRFNGIQEVSFFQTVKDQLDTKNMHPIICLQDV